jgi:hypothetical protein
MQRAIQGNTTLVDPDPHKSMLKGLWGFVLHESAGVRMEYLRV